MADSDWASRWGELHLETNDNGFFFGFESDPDFADSARRETIPDPNDTNKVTGTPLPSTTQSYLKQVMRAVIANPIGTAYGIPFASDVYGKTGTAEHGPTNMSPNAWFTAVDPNQDVAACALVLDNTLNQDNYGATNAAPEVLSLFDGL